MKETIQITTKDTSTDQEPPVSSKAPTISSIFESVLDAFKLNIFQPNFKHGFLRAYLDNQNIIKGTSPSQERP